MKVSRNWLKTYLPVEVSVERMAEILTQTGLEVEAVTPLESVRGGLAGVVVGHVVEKTQHPDADRLSLTRVDVGNGEALPIVCGAPNVAQGQKVLVATEGAVLYPKGDEKGFKIKKSKIRGQESRGMICAEDELGLGDDHCGIMVLPNDAPIGMPAADYLKLETDHIIEIGLTPNRTDAFSHFGVARDLAAFLGQDEKVSLVKPDVSAFKPGQDESKISVRVEDNERCIRYAGVLLEGVKVAPSPAWLQTRLRVIGITPKNNVVDCTNYVLHELGQPLHAFDADRIEGNTVVVKTCEADSTFTTLDDVERTLHADDLMICNAKGPICIAGVMGGKNSGVTEQTTRIFLESACFHPSSVRKTAKRHQINSDSSFRFERGVDANAMLFALKRAALLIMECAGGEVVSPIIDHYPAPVQPCKVDFSLSRCFSLIGQEIPLQTVRNIFNALDIEILGEQGDTWQLSIPTYRTDVTRQADVVEELLRIYGYDRVEIPAKLSASVNYGGGMEREYLRNLAADFLVSNGMIQMMSNSLSASTAHAKIGSALFPEDQHIKILNPLSAELDIMRRTLLVNMLEAVALNRNHKNPDLQFFEFGQVYHREEKQTWESFNLALVMTGRRFPESWNNPGDEVSYFDLRNMFNMFLQRLGFAQRCTFGHEAADYLAEGQSVLLDGQNLGYIGRVKGDICGRFDIDQPVFFAELNWSLLLSKVGSGKVKVQPIPKFPTVRRDFSLLLDRSVRFEDIEKLARKTEKKLLREVELFDVYEGKNLPEGKKSYAVRFQLRSDDRTLTDELVDGIMDRIRQGLEKELGASLR